MPTLPNLLTFTRLAGSPVVIVLALCNQLMWVLVLGVLLILTDWLDGVLARLLRQQTELGARMDTVADVLLGLTLLFSVAWLDWDFVVKHRFAILTVLATYTASGIFGLMKFRRWPSYHNYLAKGGMVIGSVAGLTVLATPLGMSPLLALVLSYLAAIIISLANLEAFAITASLNSPRDNVGSIFRLRNN